MSNETCSKCTKYLPVDVFKGICKAQGDHVGPESRACDTFESRDRCGTCDNFSVGTDTPFLGACTWEDVPTYPDLSAMYCSGYARAH